MNRLCLDTSAYSLFKRGHAEAAERLDQAGYVAVPAIVLGELHLGFLGGSRRQQNLEDLRAFLAHRVVETVPVDEDVAAIYGEIVYDLRKRGVPLPTNDIWIAATAVRVGASVLTADAHFRAIDRVGALVLEVRAEH